MHGSNIKVRVVLVNHFFLEAQSELLLPGCSIVSPPASVSLTHLPVCTDQGMSIACRFSTSKFVLKIIGNFFKLQVWGFLKEILLTEDSDLIACPLWGRWFI